MNITLKTTLSLSAAGLSMLALTSGASAQTTIGDPALTTVFSTLATGSPNYTSAAVAVGFDANIGGGKLTFSTTQATAQSVYEAFVFDSSAAGVFPGVAAGSTAQLQVFAQNKNVNPSPLVPFNIYASLYAYDPGAAVGTVPAMGSNLFGTQQKVTLGQAAGGYFSSDFILGNTLTAGSTYVLGITTLTGDTQDFANIGTTVNNKSGLSATNVGFDNNKFVTTNNDQGNPVGSLVNGTASNQDGNVFSFKLAASTPSAAPEPSQWAAMAFTGLGIAVLAVKRRRSLTN